MMAGDYPHFPIPRIIGPVELTVAMLRLDGKKKKLTLTQIVEKIMTMYRCKKGSAVPIGEIKASMEDLIAQGDVVRKGNYYYLEHDIFEKMERIEKDYNI